MKNNTYETAEESVSYRQPMQVIEFLVCPGKPYNINETIIFPICPRCDMSFEHDYQAYCGHCGQKLKWTYYHKAKPRYSGFK